jgi:UV DNA damage endonuclease
MMIGYACLAVGVRDTSIKTCRLSGASDDKLRGLISHNLESLRNIIEYNGKSGIRLFRISSDIIPFGSHESIALDWKSEFRDELESLGKLIRELGVRVSMHPGQYTVLSSPREDVAANAIRDIDYHASFLSSLGCDAKSKIVVHIGGVYGDKVSAMDRFSRNASLLSEDSRKRLVIENDDKSYNIEDAISLSRSAGFPVVFDNLHHMLNAPATEKTEKEWIIESSRTWSEDDGVQKIHYSQQKMGGSRGAHSDTIDIGIFRRFAEDIDGTGADVMLEVKDKNLSAVKCIKVMSGTHETRFMEEEWSRYKYYVLGKDQNIYNGVRKLLKDKKGASIIDFYSLIDRARGMDGSKGSNSNAIDHVWGYFRSIADERDRKKFMKLRDMFEKGEAKESSVKKHLLNLAQKHDVVYILNSLYFYIE